ncbi:hypothetical protein A2U01_0019659, partial [Trifolium medium]|nr:hypothetical protein [Trifolium medium]
MGSKPGEKEKTDDGCSVWIRSGGVEVGRRLWWCSVLRRWRFQERRLGFVTAMRVLSHFFIILFLVLCFFLLAVYWLWLLVEVKMMVVNGGLEKMVIVW